MKLNVESVNLLKQNEGLSLSCYHLGDGMCTVGYGHTRPVNTCPRAGSLKISEQQALNWLDQDINKYQNFLNYFNRTFNENQIGALTSFEYNLGSNIWKNYNWDRNASDEYIINNMRLYINKGTQFEAGLRARREREITLFKKPVIKTLYNKPDGDINGFYNDSKYVHCIGWVYLPQISGYNFVILQDEHGNEIDRKMSKGIIRDDVNKALNLPKTYAFGCEARFDFSKVKGKKVRAIFRRTQDKKGNVIQPCLDIFSQYKQF